MSYEDKEWEKIRRVLFKKRSQVPPHNILNKVMEKVGDIERNREPSDSALPFWPWWAPPLSIGFASVLLFITFLPQEPLVSIDDFLTVNGNSAFVDQLLDYSVEEEP